MADKIVYLDVEFIALKYEELTSKSPTSVLTKTQGGKANIGIPILKAGVHTQESRSYSLSSFQMLAEIYEKLMDYTTVELERFKSGTGSVTGWIEGTLTLGAWRNPKKPSEACEVFELHLSQTPPNVSLLTNNDYFYPGIGAIINTSPALKLNVEMPVKSLAKILYFAEGAKSFVAVPLLIIEAEL